MRTKYCITFAGAPGISKSTIAHHLGWNLGLPVFSNDVLRKEVGQDFGTVDEDEYVRRRDERGIALMDSGKSFIYDASVDRAWELNSQRLIDRGYDTFVISLDFSKKLIRNLYSLDNRSTSNLEVTMRQHEAFLQKYEGVVGLHLHDSDFAGRLALSLKSVEAWIESDE